MAVKNPNDYVVIAAAGSRQAYELGRYATKREAQARKKQLVQGDNYNRPSKYWRIVRKRSVANPAAASFPKGKFVKVQAVRVNRDGTITVKK